MIWVMRSWLGAGVLLVVAGFMLAESGEGLVGVVVGWVAVGLGIVLFVWAWNRRKRHGDEEWI